MNKFTFNEMIDLFKFANEDFLKKEQNLFKSEVSERTLCGALMLHLNNVISIENKYKEYYTDIECNRNIGNIKTNLKTTRLQNGTIIRINCDLIFHSRFEQDPDNLIALEMKKSSRKRCDKDSDRERLKALTSCDICGEIVGMKEQQDIYVHQYLLGVYYEIDFKRQIVLIEYYKRGKLFKKEECRLCDY